MKTAKTNAIRLLDRLGVRYELREYEVEPEDLAAETVTRKVGLPPEQVFKTLVARGDLRHRADGPTGRVGARARDIGLEGGRP